MSKPAETALAAAIGAIVSILLTPWIVKWTLAYAYWVME